MRAVTIKKYRAIQKRYKQLYDEMKMRSDVCVALIMEEFYISAPNTVYRIIATELGAEVVYKDPNQLELPFPDITPEAPDP